MSRFNKQTAMVGSTMGTGLPNVSMQPAYPRNANTSGPTPMGHLDNFNADNGAVGANAMANPVANSGTTVGNALTQLYQTELRDPTLSGGQFPPGAPVVSGGQQFIGPSETNSGGAASTDAVKRMDYINSLPWNAPGAAVNGPPVQYGSPSQLGQSLQGLISPPGVKNARAHALNTPPQVPYNLTQAFPSGVGGGGLR